MLCNIHKLCLSEVKGNVVETENLEYKLYFHNVSGKFATTANYLHIFPLFHIILKFYSV